MEGATELAFSASSRWTRSWPTRCDISMGGRYRLGIGVESHADLNRRSRRAESEGSCDHRVLLFEIKSGSFGPRPEVTLSSCPMMFIAVRTEKCRRTDVLARPCGKPRRATDEDVRRTLQFGPRKVDVHLLVAFGTESSLKDQCASWLRYTARQLDRTTGSSGKFWQPEPFDHLVRGPEQYDSLRQYIADNPRKANLRPGESLYRRYA